MEVYKRNLVINTSFIVVVFLFFGCQANKEKNDNLSRNLINKEAKEIAHFKFTNSIVCKNFKYLLLNASKEYLETTKSLTISPDKANALLLSYCVKESKRIGENYSGEVKNDDFYNQQGLIELKRFSLLGIEQNKYVFMRTSFNKNKMKCWTIIYDGISINAENGEFEKIDNIELPYCRFYPNMCEECSFL